MIFKIDYRTKFGRGVKAAETFTRALYDPHFARQFWCWSHMQRTSEERPLPQGHWIEDACYCLDRTEAVSPW